MLAWAFRCTPVLSSALLLLVTYSAVQEPGDGSPSFYTKPRCYTRECWKSLTVSQFIYIAYTLLMHLQLLIYGPQLCISLHWLTRNIKAVRDCCIARNLIAKSNKSSDVDFYTDSGYTSDDSLTSGSDVAITLPDQPTAEDNVVHAIIIPNYMEELDTLKETLSVLATHARAQQQYEVYLAMEEKEPGAPLKATKLFSEYEKSFRNIRSTFHPAGVPGEIAGKSANVAYAASKILERHRASADGDNVLITIIDADTHLLQDYFSEVRRLHCTYAETAQCTIYCCPIIFDRNSNESPLLVRCADIMWSWAGISGMYPNNPIQIPTSVYSVPLRLAETVNGWDAGPGAIGEDMHMLIKSFFGVSGRLTTRTVFSAASQCNVSGSRKHYQNFPIDIDSLHARYRQGMRHMWGALDSGFALSRFLRSIHFPNLKHVALTHMLWQAHFFPVHLVLSLAGGSIIPIILGIRHVHPALDYVSTLCTHIRTLTFLGLNFAFYFYDRYHDACAEARAQDMADAELPSHVSFRKRWHWRYVGERVAFPVAGFLYGTMPATTAEVCHLWTDRLIYVVSKKPQFSIKLGSILRAS